VRTRKDKSLLWLPERVYVSKSGAFEYHPPGGGSKTIAPKGAAKSVVLREYERMFEEQGTVQALKDSYCKTSRFKRLANGTKKQYEWAWDRLKPVFGQVVASTLRPHHVRKYMDLRGKKTEKGANTERIFLKLILDYGIEYNHLEHNPCDKVKPFILEARDRYVTDQEYQEFYDQAPEIVRIFMEFAYICASRGQDIRRIKISDITAEGVYIKQRKTGKDQTKLWNDRLRSLVKRAQKLRKARLEKRNVSSMYLIVTPSGGPYSAPGLSGIWNRAKREFEKNNETTIDWTFHDLKAKGISDFEGDKQNFSGHKDKLMMERYNRSPDKTPVIDF